MRGNIQWQDCPRADGGEHAWTIVQTPPRGRLQVVCISPRLTGCMVHFWNNRTIGCTGDECEACGKNRAKFWEGYFAALQANTLARLIVRVTEKIGGQINLWLANHKTMRGAQLELDRPSRTPNGRIRLQIAEGLADVPDRIVEPDMHKLLCHIWRLEKMPDRGVEPLPTSIEFDKLERNFARANGRKRIQPGV